MLCHGRDASDAVKSLVTGDADLAERVIDGDDEIDARCLGIEERALETIATQFPVARDLRLLHSLTYIACTSSAWPTCPSTSRRPRAAPPAARAPDALRPHPGSGQPRLPRARRDGEALENRDLELARKLPELDEPIDHLYKQFFRELARLHDEEDIEWASSMVLASRYLERIADNAVDIGERIAYLVTGRARGSRAPSRAE